MEEQITTYTMESGRKIVFQRGGARVVVGKGQWDVQVKRGGKWVEAKGYVHPDLVYHAIIKTKASRS